MPSPRPARGGDDHARCHGGCKTIGVSCRLQRVAQKHQVPDNGPPAVGGKANRAITDLLAEIFGVSRADVTIIAGHTSSSKTVAIAGVSRSHALACLETAGT